VAIPIALCVAAGIAVWEALFRTDAARAPFPERTLLRELVLQPKEAGRTL